MTVMTIRVTILLGVIGVLVVLLMLPGCTGAYRAREPLGPTRIDPLPVCDSPQGKCVRT